MGTHKSLCCEPRSLTNREQARLQTFSDDHEFISGIERYELKFDMEVPVKGANIIVEAILNTFADDEFHPNQHDGMKMRSGK